MNGPKMLILTSALITLLGVNSLYAAENTSNVKLTDAEVGSLATIASIDKGEILISIVANNKRPSTNVADFAKMMIEQHGSNLTQILEIVNHAHVTALRGGDSDIIKTQNAKGMMALGGLQGEQFDKAYADAMVKGHEGALNMIDNTLMKTAKSEEMKKFLTDTRAVVVEHLEHAKKLQASLKS